MSIRMTIEVSAMDAATAALLARKAVDEMLATNDISPGVFIGLQTGKCRARWQRIPAQVRLPSEPLDSIIPS